MKKKSKALGLSYGNQLLLLVVLAFALNVNTLYNQYALDDVVVMTGNSLVKKGIKGIPEILTKDMFYGLDKKTTDLSGGRYRPVSLMTFALEHELFGENPLVSHLFNLMLFVLLTTLLFKILRAHVFKDQHPYLAFVTCLLFVAHPIHTEVVANIKSRDELLTFVFLLLSSFSLIRYARHQRKKQMILALIWFLLALLTRESAVPFIGIVPLVAWFFYGQSIKNSLKWALPLGVVFMGYMVLRSTMVGFGHSDSMEILNVPYLFASPAQAFATKIYVLYRYLLLLGFPYPLSCDYGFNQIPYVNLISFPFIGSLVLWIALGIYAWYTFRKRSVYSFCIFFFLLTIFLFSNFVINIGAPMADRLLFQPSLAFCTAVALGLITFWKRQRVIASLLLAGIVIPFSLKTVMRNREWKNNETLYLTDVVSAPNSVRTNLYAAHEYLTLADAEHNTGLREEYLRKAVSCDEKIAGMDPHYAPIYEDLGMGYFGLKNYLKAADYWVKDIALEPENPFAQKRVNMLSDLLYNEGNQYYKAGLIDSAIVRYRKAVDLNTSNVDAWYNLGRSYFANHSQEQGMQAWEVVARLKPDYAFRMGAPK
ncbi:MAG TPA: tetratricopeptide repeat protein [Bacteroidia bacterium]|nr:tetratricopeptide repeat protein [Bacteroidia bacterium]